MTELNLTKRRKPNARPAAAAPEVVGMTPGELRQRERDGGTRNPPITDAMMARIERLFAEELRKADRRRAREEHDASPSRSAATLETWERNVRRKGSPLDRMLRLGKITQDEHNAACEIASIVEMIESDVQPRTSSFEMPVDNPASGRNVLVEGLLRVRLEVAYRAWSKTLPVPRRMIIDMIVSDNVPYVRLARRYRMHWRTARKRLLTALRIWPGFVSVARAEIDRERLDEIHEQIERIV